ncbi:MAG: glycosyltransferase family 4 protein [Microcoleaceae cyanobacterium]
MRCLNVLISAYACRPGEGSEPGVGWNIAQEIAKYHKVWVFTRENNRSYIEHELEQHPLPNLNFVYCEPSKGLQALNNNQRLVHLHYYFWQVAAYFMAHKLHPEIQFDVVHHVTYVRYSTPSFLSLLPIPFVWGPVGGGEMAPRPFWKDFSLRGKVYEMTRGLAHRMGELDPFVRMTAERSHRVRATTSDTAQRLRHIGAKNIEVFSESALSSTEIEHLAQTAQPEDSTLRFISMARLLHWKGLHLSIRAFAKADLAHAEYWILGDGPERNSLQVLAEDLGVSGQVKFWGRLPRHETLQKLGHSHVLIHPSLHDSGGWVCLEAMAAGRPVICLDLGGPAVQVTSETGLKIPAKTPDQTIQDLANAIRDLGKDKTLREHMGRAGQALVRQEFSWETKGERLAQLYINILENCGE